MRTPRTLALLAAAVTLISCDAATFGPEPGTDAAADQLALMLADAAGMHELDAATAGPVRPVGPNGVAVFEQLDTRIPGFGGLYRVTRCGVVVVLVQRADVQRAIRIVHAVVAPLVAESCPTGIRVRAERGSFTWKQLRRFHSLALPLTRADDVLAAHIDFPTNTVLISVADRTVASRVQTALAQLGVPGQALTFRAGASSALR